MVSGSDPAGILAVIVGQRIGHHQVALPSTVTQKGSSSP